MSNEKYFGQVIWFQGGMGFIYWEKEGVKQKDMFVHYSDILCDGFKILYKGQQVSFGIGANNHNQPKAIEVVVLKN